MDKAFWKSIVDHDYAVPEGRTVAGLTPELLSFLGSTDIEVRDPFGYMIFAHWLVRDSRYSPREIRDLRETLLANLEAGLGEHDTDSVFLRSFSMLVLSLIAYRDAQQSFLTKEEIVALLDSGLAYFAAEQDLRGYVPDKGWAHSCAHTADLLKFLARNPMTGREEHERILSGIADKLLMAPTYVYIHSEDERIVSALLDVIKRDAVKPGTWTAWLGRFTAWKQSWPEDGEFSVPIHATWLNVKTMLRSLFIRLEVTPELPPLATQLKPAVLETLKGFGQ